MKLTYDGRFIKVVDESGIGFYVAQVTILESNHATMKQKQSILKAALAKLTAEEIQAILE
jgi:hypothetical protein